MPINCTFFYWSPSGCGTSSHRITLFELLKKTCRSYLPCDFEDVQRVPNSSSFGRKIHEHPWRPKSLPTFISEGSYWIANLLGSRLWLPNAFGLIPSEEIYVVYHQLPFHPPKKKTYKILNSKLWINTRGKTRRFLVFNMDFFFPSNKLGPTPWPTYVQVKGFPSSFSSSKQSHLDQQKMVFRYSIGVGVGKSSSKWPF